MMPERLTIEAFGPYVKKQEIDFQEFRRAGLFLIHGKTGAGKTMVLDAMTYALFGESSGGGRGDMAAMRSDFAKDDQDTQVSFTFCVGQRRYRFLRGVRIRAKRNGEKEPQIFQSAFFENEAGEFEPYFENPGVRNVRLKAEEILGLSYEQFRQIILLPQGRFEQLLVADSAEKEAILVTLFKAERWSELTNWLCDQALILKRAKDEKSQAVDSILAQYEQGSQQELEEEYNRKNAELERLKKERMLADEQEKLAQSALQNAQMVQTLFEEREQAYIKKEEIKTRKPDIVKLEQMCEKARLAAELLPARREVATLQNQMKERETAAKEAQQQKEDRKKALMECVGRLLGMQDALQQKNSVLKSGIAQQKERQEKAEQEYQSSFAAYVNDAAYMLAESLEEGLACPVCGSTHHPQPAFKSETQTTAQDVKRAEQTVKQATGKIVQLEKEFYEAAREMEACTNVLERYQELSAEAEKKKEDSGRLNEWLKKADEALGGLRAAEASRLMYQKEYEQSKREFEAAMKAFQAACRECGFQTDEEFRNSCMTQQQMEQARQEIRQYEVQRQLAETSLKALDEKLAGVDKPDIMALQSSRAQAEEKRRLAAEREAAKKARLNLMEEAIGKLKKLGADLKKKTDEYVELDQFSRILRGSNGVSLQRYVLGVMLSAITQEANRLLARVHDGRYQLYRSMEGTGRARRAGLDLEVFDSYCGEKRSVGSLSGGEKFLVALALSLGLSTVVQAQSGGVHIDAMFIDEGFGSLDPSSIENALDVLASVRGGSKLVGIISHVQILKENIEASIEVRKGQDGSDLLLNY